jgi:hypothetical protein
MNNLLIQRYVRSQGLPVELFDVSPQLRDLADDLESTGVPRTKIDELVIAAMGQAAANTLAYASDHISGDGPEAA